VFLQVAATTRPEAALLLEVLEGRGFSGRLAPVPGQELSRVLIGPLADASAVSETRSALQAAGFEPFARRY
jgi:cell division protein FtsN